MATWFPSKNFGSGQPHMLCPMEKYISTSRKPSEAASLRSSFGVSRSLSSSASGAAARPAAPLGLAP